MIELPLYYSLDNILTKIYVSKSQFTKKPSIQSTFVSFLERFSNSMPCLLFLHRILKHLLVYFLFVECHIKAISSRHKVIVVDNLKKWLYFAPLCYLLLAHAFCNFAWILINACN